MFISKQLADEIAREIRNIIPFYFNIMDDTGLILTCSDPVRIGTYHKGISLMVKNDLNELIVERENQYPGCTQGVLLTIRYAAKIVGFFGIKGEATEILDYGRIIQKMMELLVYEKFETYIRETNEHGRLALINNLIYGNFESTYFDIKKDLINNGINENGPFTVGLISYTKSQKISDNKSFLDAQNKIFKRYILNQLEEKKILAATNNGNCILISNYTSEVLCKIINKLSDNVLEIYKFQLLGSISNEYDNMLDIPRAFIEVNSMMQYLTEISSIGIYAYNPNKLDFIVKQIASVHKENLFKTVFLECSQEEICDFKDLIIGYVACNGSLNLLSEKYYQHKNTIQYKIKKIYRLTGLDMRQTEDLFILYIAALHSTGEKIK